MYTYFQITLINVAQRTHFLYWNAHCIRDIEVKNNLTIARGEWGGDSEERGLQKLLCGVSYLLICKYSTSLASLEYIPLDHGV